MDAADGDLTLPLMYSIAKLVLDEVEEVFKPLKVLVCRYTRVTESNALNFSRQALSLTDAFC